MTFRAIPFNPLPSAGAFVAPSLRLMRFLARDRASCVAREAWPLLFFLTNFGHTHTHTPQIGILALSIGKKKCSKVHHRVLDIILLDLKRLQVGT